MGAQRYATENGLELTTFYSIDTLKTHEVDLTVKDGRNDAIRVNDVRRRNKNIPSEQQHEIWDILPSNSNHMPGKLELCVGMPVMIRFNEATECCITKGAEATVVGWDAGIKYHGMPVLETLFVELKNPPSLVQIDGLPPNVVPISRRQEDIVCILMNGEKLALSRSQVPILINFAMTDYSSQGRTRPNNPVDLQNCRSHFSYYTALSRSATSEGTIIVQGFEKRHIQGGASGYLRQEFRELELLDEITKQMFEGQLPKDFGGNTRNVLIKQFREMNGENYMPSSVHKSIAWSPENPFRISSSHAVASWQFAAKSKHVGKQKVSRKAHVAAVYVPAIGSVPVNSVSVEARKRKADETVEGGKGMKKRRTAEGDDHGKSRAPTGFAWDEENWSCCYDSLLTVLLNVWFENPRIWTTAFRKLSPEMKCLSDGFRKLSNDEIDAETARDRMRVLVNAKDPESFPYGESGGRIHVLTDMLGVAHKDIQLDVTYCRQCGNENSSESALRVCIDCPDDSKGSTQAFLDNHMLHRSVLPCNKCASINKVVRVSGKSRARILELKGIVYSDGKHYTARFIEKGDMWFHDGASTGRECVRDGEFEKTTEGELFFRGEAKAVVAVYAKRNRG
ncbi:hypothetical protein HWV62_29334 [Athelia sp. TMB]|nr:hypothetical protein HWV62_29334 [Athelia sp. TMB]